MLIQRLIAIDDDLLYLNLLKEFARLFNLDYDGYSNSSSLPFNSLKPTDLVLVDIYMPNDDGLDVLMALEKSNFSGYVAVMSGASEDIISSVTGLVDSLGINLLGKLQKPIKIADFQHLVTSVPEPSRTFGMTAESAESFSKVFNKKSLPEWFKHEYIYPVFQPQVSSKSISPRAIECLTRVAHPVVGHLTPAIFIRLVESAGLIDEYTLRFIQKSLEILSPLLKSSPNLSCSFNISAMSLDIDFAEKLVLLVKHSNVSAKQVTLEITESSAVKMSKEGLYAISRLKVSGFSLAIDDFGTGFSSIRQLIELPFDELKIDRSFINEIEKNKSSQAIVNLTIDLAKSLGCKLVIEGVETKPQLELLQKKGDFIIQGYYFSKPLKYQELIEYLQNPKT
ncbi:MAG: EAL domain-containing response regulator [Gammaproteobacteria bacterium]|nr:EAL domain-containing response regulator [Gammaproteobacteria bacterium]